MKSLTEPIGSIPRPPGGPFCCERYADSYFDLLHEHETEVRNRLRLGACEVQIDTASAKIRARVLGTSLAAEEPGV